MDISLQEMDIQGIAGLPGFDFIKLDRNIPYDLTTGKEKQDINNHKPQGFFSCTI